MTERPKFEEIDVERINVREPDGTLRLTISNKARSPDPDLEDTPFDRTGKRDAGLLFFNDIGRECGGLAYGGTQRGDAGAGLFFDRFSSDQTIGVVYTEGPQDKYGASFFVQDRPVMDRDALIARLSAVPADELEAALVKETGNAPMRVAMGRDKDGSAGVFVMDSAGRPRIMLTVDASDNPRILMLDADGNVTFSLPPEA
jgi:hypothetical protein